MTKPYHLPPEEANQTRQWWKTKAILGLLMVVFLTIMAVGGLVAYLRLYTGTAGTPIGTGGTSVIPSLTPTPTSSPITETIMVFFSRRPESEDNFQLVYQVHRMTTEPNLPQAAMAALIAGPTLEEQANNLFSEWHLSGDSTCGGRDFTLAVNDSTATLRLCRDFQSSGIGQDARAQAQADTTLKQFSNITRTVYLNKSGNCLFDQSGQNSCLP